MPPQGAGQGSAAAKPCCCGRCHLHRWAKTETVSSRTAAIIYLSIHRSTRPNVQWTGGGQTTAIDSAGKRRLRFCVVAACRLIAVWFDRRRHSTRHCEDWTTTDVFCRESVWYHVGAITLTDGWSVISRHDIKTDRELTTNDHPATPRHGFTTGATFYRCQSCIKRALAFVCFSFFFLAMCAR